MKKTASKHRRAPKSRSRSAGTSRRKNNLRAVPRASTERAPRREISPVDSLMARLNPYLDRVGFAIGRAARGLGRLIGRDRGTRVPIRHDSVIDRRVA